MAAINSGLLAESNPELVALIRAEIARAGRIPFARFMELAIYHPTHGYYASAEIRAGTAGDFLTAPETHPIFGLTLARQVVECWQLMERPDAFTLREYGAGRGTLARDLLIGLQIHAPDAFAAMCYELQDLNEQRMQEALEMLADSGFEEQVATASEQPVRGMILANELLDSLPFHRLIYSNGDLREIYVAWHAGWFVDEYGPLSNKRLATPLQSIELREGQRLEVSPATQNWAGVLGQRLESGFALLIDYGYPAQELYSAEDRLEGTLRTYHAHLAGIEPYRHVGRQDITAHVDFTSISEAAGDSGLSELGLTTQAYFMAGLGIEEVLMNIQKTATDPYTYVNAREAVMHLIDPRGLGRFRVLALAQHVPENTALRGFSFHL